MSKLTDGDFRAYTLKPHWAHAIAHLGKRCENRTRPIPKGLVGKRVAIHAGAWSGIERVAWLDELDAAFPGTKAERRRLTHGGLAPHPSYASGIAHASRMHCSSFVATAVLASSCAPGADTLDLRDTQWTAWAMPGFWWWRLTDVHTLRCPVPVARGAQGPWRLTQEQVDAINAQGGGL